MPPENTQYPPSNIFDSFPQDIFEISDSNFQELDIQKLQKSDYSAERAMALGVALINTSWVSAKVLYEILLPPELSGETVYLHGPRFFDQYIFPDFLITDRAFCHSGCRKEGPEPILIIAKRVDRDGHVAESDHKHATFGPHGCIERFSIQEELLIMTKFWGHDIYDITVAARDKCFWCYESNQTTDCSRSMNNARIQKLVRHSLGAELDLIEFLCHYGLKEVVWVRIPHWSTSWQAFSRIEAQPDVAQAMEAGARQALDERAHYIHQKVLFEYLAECKYKALEVGGVYPHPGWFVEGDSRETGHFKLAGPWDPTSTPPAKVSPMKNLQPEIDKVMREDDELTDWIRKHSDDN